MKKVLCLIICMLTIAFVFGDSSELLKSYFEESNLENIKAILDDANQSKDVASANMNLLLVHFSEMSKAINMLEENAENLQAGQRFQLANIYLALGKYNEAITHYNILNKNFADWSCPWRHKGEAYFNLEKWEEAESALEKAIETRVEHYDAYLWLAKTQLKLKKNKAALKTFETAMSYKGKDIEDPEEEFSSEDEKFLKLDILKANKMKKEYKELEKKLREKYPDNKYWD